MEFKFEKPKNINLKTTIINGKYISSALIWRPISYYSNGWAETYETFVWEWDEKNQLRGVCLYETYQNSKEECLRVHEHMINNFKNTI